MTSSPVTPLQVKHAQVERAALVLAARILIDQEWAEALDTRTLARQAHLSPYHFIRVFRATYGLTPHQYLTRRRLEQAKQLLTTSMLSVTEICMAVGFSSLGSFSALFQRHTGRSPQHFRLLMLARRRFIPRCFLAMAGVLETPSV
jgi:AraC-like DNA-binding protein